MTLLDSALALAQKGFRVFPLAPLSKQPIFSSYHQKSTTDPDKIRGWWQHKTRIKNYNVGVHLPGILVVDIDGPVGEESFELLTQDHPCQPTAEVSTGSGRHLYYRLPAGVRAVPRPLDVVEGFEHLDRIDIKGSGGLVAGPGSLHKSGTTYAWTTEPATAADLTPAPAWMIQHLCGPEQPKYLQEIGGDTEIEEANSDRILLETCLVRWPFVAKEGAKR
ncbi:MAG: bifunctional DNA primase/polymerase, partial [Gemmataceae bacterium]